MAPTLPEEWSAPCACVPCRLATTFTSSGAGLRWQHTGMCRHSSEDSRYTDRRNDHLSMPPPPAPSPHCSACGHAFCKDCAAKLVLLQGVCAVCRQKVTPTQVRSACCGQVPQSARATRGPLSPCPTTARPA